MALIHLTSENFDSVINSEKPVMVDFWAQWCGPCRMFGPTVDALANEVGDTAVVCKLDVDEAPEIAERYSITAVPTVLFFKKGKQVDACGMSSKDVLKTKLAKMV